MKVVVIQEAPPTVHVVMPSASAIALAGGAPVPGPGPTPAEIASAVAEYLTANPPAAGDPGKNATSEQIAAAVAAYFLSNPVPDSIPSALKGQPGGVAELDGGGGLAQRMKVAGGSTPAVIRDTQGEGNGKASLVPASIATNGADTILLKTGVWQSELDYAFRLFGTTAAGVVDITAYRTVIDYSPSYGFTNSGIVPVTVVFGVFADGYSGWAIQGAGFGRAQFIVTDAAVVGDGTGDPQVRDWSMSSAADASALNSQVTVSRRTLE